MGERSKGSRQRGELRAEVRRRAVPGTRTEARPTARIPRTYEAGNGLESRRSAVVDPDPPGALPSSRPLSSRRGRGSMFRTGPAARSLSRSDGGPDGMGDRRHAPDGSVCRVGGLGRSRPDPPGGRLGRRRESSHPLRSLAHPRGEGGWRGPEGRCASGGTGSGRFGARMPMPCEGRSEAASLTRRRPAPEPVPFRLPRSGRGGRPAGGPGSCGAPRAPDPGRGARGRPAGGGPGRSPPGRRSPGRASPPNRGIRPESLSRRADRSGPSGAGSNNR